LAVLRRRRRPPLVEYGGLDRRQLTLLLKTALGGAAVAVAVGGAQMKRQAGGD
jgi:hypothetical protein